MTSNTESGPGTGRTAQDSARTKSDWHGGWYHVTRWSLVLRAGDSGSPEQMKALDQLCQSYRPAVLAYVRSRGYNKEDAEDLTQSFFAYLLEKKVFAKIHPSRGRFRGFLRQALKNFLANQWHKTQSQRNGGGVALVPLEETGPTAATPEPADHHTPDKAWDYQWALTVMNNAFEKLCADYTRRGDATLYELLHQYLVEEEDSPCYAQAAKRLGKTEDAVKMAAMRLRERYGDRLRSEIHETVGTAEEQEDEINHLLAVLAEGPQ